MSHISLCFTYATSRQTSVSARDIFGPWITAGGCTHDFAVFAGFAWRTLRLSRILKRRECKDRGGIEFGGECSALTYVRACASADFAVFVGFAWRTLRSTRVFTAKDTESKTQRTRKGGAWRKIDASFGRWSTQLTLMRRPAALLR